MYITYISDIRGSITSIVNDNGHFIQGYRYTDYGITTRIGSGAFNEFAYTQGIWDETTGLYYLNGVFPFLFSAFSGSQLVNTSIS